MDFAVTNERTIWVFWAKSPEARDEMEDMGLESWQMLGKDSFAVDHRPAGQLVEQLRENGFTVGGAA